ncbi:MAG: aromatic ring-hydroxylating dioxygenase subunit alpha, partial [Myxococcota bacterium]
MRHQNQVSNLRRLLELREHETFVMSDQVYKIPVSRYTDAKTYDREMSTVFRDYPQLAGHACHLKEPGSFLLSDWPAFPFVVVRGNDGVLRGFLNQCRHRGARLLSQDSEKTCIKAFVCPFHNWVYELDGSLRSINRDYMFPNLDRSQYGLVELPVLERAGLVWIHPQPGASIALDDFLGPMADDIDHFGIDELVSYRKSIVVRKANWKLLIKTYLEGYHVPFLHRTTISESFKKAVIAPLEYGKHIRLCASRTNIFDVANQPEDNWRILDFASVYYSLFPQAFFILHPDYVSINMFHPLGPERTLWTHEMLYRPQDFVGENGQKALEKRFAY